MKIMKYIVIFFIITFVVIYICFFSITNELLIDFGSFRFKSVKSVCFVYSTEIHGDNISDFVLKNGLKETESWQQFSYTRNGFLSFGPFIDDESQKLIFRYRIFRKWVNLKMDDKNISETDKENLIKPVVIEFMKCLGEKDSGNTSQLINRLRLEVENKTAENHSR